MKSFELQTLAGSLSVKVGVLEKLRITREDGYWVIPERNAIGEIVGYATRDDNAAKGFKWLF